MIAMVLALAGSNGPARAQDAQASPLRAIAKGAGLAIDPAPPPAFVMATRPAGEPAPIPVFATPEEPPSKIKSAADLKAMDADLERAGKRHDAIRAAFPPSAKAMAEAEAAAAKKAKKKRDKPPATAATEK